MPGISIAEGWNQTAKVMKDIALVRSMTNKEGNHQRATYQLHTGYVPSATIKHPHLGCSIVGELGESQFDLPHIVSIGGATIGAGFLGAALEPFVVQNPRAASREHPAEGRRRPVPASVGLLERLEGAGFETNRRRRPGPRPPRALPPDRQDDPLASHAGVSASTRSPSRFAKPTARTPFGQGCLLARRLVQAGVTFVEVRSNGWDTHQQNHERVGKLARQVDPAFRHAGHRPEAAGHARRRRWSSGWVSSAARPRSTPNAGRDHFPKVFNVALAGGGVKGGQVIGASNADGTDVKDHPVTVPDLLASLCHALKVDPTKETMTPIGRPIKIVDGGKPVSALFG